MVSDRLGGQGLRALVGPPEGWAGTFSLADPVYLRDSRVRTEVTLLDSGELEPEPASVSLQPPHGICLAQGGRRLERWKLVRAWEKLVDHSSFPPKQQGPKLPGGLVRQAHLPGVPAGPALASWEEGVSAKNKPQPAFPCMLGSLPLLQEASCVTSGASLAFSGLPSPRYVSGVPTARPATL